MAAADGLTRPSAPAEACAVTPGREQLAARYAEFLAALRHLAPTADAAGAPSGGALTALRGSGLLAAAVPAAHGGTGGDALLTNRLVELVATADPSVAIILFQHYAVSARIAEWGTPGQRARWLPRLADGSWLAASAWSESGAGADKRHLATRAVRTDGGWVLDGAKTFTTGAGIAQLYLVLAQSAPSAGPAEPAGAGSAGAGSGYGGDGQTFYLVEAENPGLTADTGMDLVGMRASATGFVELTSCRVTDAAVLGPAGDAVRVIAGVRESGATLGAVAVGIAEAAYRLALTHAVRRGLRDQQAVRHRLVDLSAKVAAARALVDTSGRRDTADPGVTTLHSKLFASQCCEEVTAEALRLLGGAGYLREHPLNQLALDARAVGLMGPTNDLCRELVSAPWTH
ncbi:acyl-CoA dehydrogenase family protein [Streptomyces sp. WMMC897]|uniref:acyl-CoA dehydrogenase family protein n=1 Tax=Streptomyces sp. WMMC897 TaxID=3014782 RepID=UPI0022B6792E|nr:acyl-CoA dehydrogenase family protein [Streptomyces sp. WMMC897]MCZ7414673.1 acyl-CoA dehydrogenase family protein [Streptomyces sp. WMMC897]